MRFLIYLLALFLWERWYMGGSLSISAPFRRNDMRRRARRALEVNPAEFDSRVDLARDAVERGRSARALELLEPILSRADAAEVHRLHGEALLGTGRAEAAAQAFRKALSLDRREIESRLGLAKSLGALARSEEARKEIEAYRVTRPGDARGSWAESAIRKSLGDSKGALDALHELVKEQRLKPGYARLAEATTARSRPPRSRGCEPGSGTSWRPSPACR